MRLANYHKDRVVREDCGGKKTRSTASSRSGGPRHFALARPSAGRGRGAQKETPRYSVVPRRVKTIEEAILLWRHGDPGKGSEYPLRRIQTAKDRNTVIKGHTNDWWEKFGHEMPCPGI
jgi:hypothetical protein